MVSNNKRTASGIKTFRTSNLQTGQSNPKKKDSKYLNYYRVLSKQAKIVPVAGLMGITALVGNYIHDRVYNQIPELQTFEYDPNTIREMLTGGDDRYTLHGSAIGIEIPESNPEDYSGLSELIAERHENRDPFRHYDLEDLLVSLLTIESRGDQYAKSRVNARGILQIMPNTARECGISENTYNRILNMDCAADLLIRSYNYLKPRVEAKFGPYLRNGQIEELTEHFAVTAYNNGMGNVRKAIQRYDLGVFEGVNVGVGPLDLQEIVPRVIGAGNVGALRQESREYFPRFLQIHDEVVNAPIYSPNRWRWETGL